MFGASLRRAVAVAGTTLNNAKAKAEASIAPETKAKIGAAVVKLNDFSKATGQSASGERIAVSYCCLCVGTGHNRKSPL